MDRWVDRSVDRFMDGRMNTRTDEQMDWLSYHAGHVVIEGKNRKLVIQNTGLPNQKGPTSWMDGCICGWTDVQTTGWMHRWMDGCVDVTLDGWLDGRCMLSTAYIEVSSNVSDWLCIDSIAAQIIKQTACSTDSQSHYAVHLLFFSTFHAGAATTTAAMTSCCLHAHSIAI